MKLAAMWIADMKVCAQRSYRVATRRQSLSFANMFSMRWRFYIDASCKVALISGYSSAEYKR